MELRNEAAVVDVESLEYSSADEIGGFGLMFDLLPSMAFAERDGRIVAWNTLARRMLGLGAPVSRPLSEIFLDPVEIPPDGFRLCFDNMLLRRDGTPLPVSCAVKEAALDGRRCRLILAIEQTPVRPVERDGPMLEDLLDASPEAAVIVHCNRVLHFNRKFTELFGYQLEDCIGLDLPELIIPEGLRHEFEVIEHQLMAEGRASIETERRTRSGELIAVSVLASHVRLGTERHGYYITYRDIRLQKEQEARLRYSALHDVLTGLPNRALFLDRVQLTMSRMRRRPDRNFSIFFIDLDGFKQVNDTYGHAAGDALLLVVAERLRACLRPQDTIARFGGDEFALLLDEIGDDDGLTTVAAVAARIQSGIGEPVPLASSMNGEEAVARVSASIGIAIGDLRYRCGEEMLRDADRAMYDAKTAGKARHTIFAARPEVSSQAQVSFP